MEKRLEMLDVVELAKDIIQIPSYTPLDDEKFLACEDCIKYLEQKFIDMGAKTKKFTFSGAPEGRNPYKVPNLLTKIEIGNTDEKNHKVLCYVGHIDVVKTDGLGKWKHDPFSAKIEDGFIFGRGATDMKGSVAAWTSAMSKLKNNTTNANLTIYSIITGDEEWSAINGTDKVLAQMQKEGIKPDAFLIGEPSSPDYLGTNIKVGRRGSLTGLIEVTGVGGHVAYDDLIDSPIDALNCAMMILKRKNWKDGKGIFPNTNLEFVTLSSGQLNMGTNVVPDKASANYNIRFTPFQNPEDLYKSLKELLRNPPKYLRKAPGYELLKNNLDDFVRANINSASAGYYSEPRELAFAAKEAIFEDLNVDTKFDGGGGSTDGRFIPKYFPEAEIIELGDAEKGGIVGKKLQANYGREGGMHQLNERASVDNLYKLSDLYVKTVLKYGVTVPLNRTKGREM